MSKKGTRRCLCVSSLLHHRHKKGLDLSQGNDDCEATKYERNFFAGALDSYVVGLYDSVE